MTLKTALALAAAIALAGCQRPNAERTAPTNAYLVDFGNASYGLRFDLH